MKTNVLYNGNFGGTPGNSDSELGVEKNICDEDAEKGNPEFARISKIQTKHLTRLQTQPSDAAEVIHLGEKKISQ